MIRGILLLALLASLAVSLSNSRADVPASNVTIQPVTAGQSYPAVQEEGEGWFDVGGFCKIVDVGDLSWTNPPASYVPVFIPGPAEQWENYRTMAPNGYHGNLVLTTCCRPQQDIGTACATGTNPQSITRAYGRYGEVDQQTYNCIDSHGLGYQEIWNIACQGATGNGAVDNGPDGQALWALTADTQVCAPNAWTTPCSAACPTTTGTSTTYDSCNNVQSVSSCSITCGQSCPGYLGTLWTVGSYQCYAQLGNTAAPFTTVTITDSTDWLINGNVVSDRGTADVYCDGNTGTLTTVTPISCAPSTGGGGPGPSCSPGYDDCGPCIGGGQICNGTCGAGGSITQSCTTGGGPTCNPSSVSNGTVNGDCSITCNSGYMQSGSSCIPAGPPTGNCAAYGGVLSQCSEHQYTCTGGPNIGTTYNDCGNSCDGNAAPGDNTFASPFGSNWTDFPCTCTSGYTGTNDVGKGPEKYICN